jgi:hypothetical protein
MQGPNTSKKKMATIGHRKGKNCPGGEPGFYLVAYLCTNLSFERLFLDTLTLLENVVCTFLYNA